MTNKDIILRLEFHDPHEIVSLPAHIVKTEVAQGRKEIIVVAIQYDAEKIPITYKLHINSYLSGLRKSQLSTYHSAPVTASSVSATPRGIGASSAQKAAHRAQTVHSPSALPQPAAEGAEIPQANAEHTLG